MPCMQGNIKILFSQSLIFTQQSLLRVMSGPLQNEARQLSINGITVIFGLSEICAVF